MGICREQHRTCYSTANCMDIIILSYISLCLHNLSSFHLSPFHRYVSIPPVSIPFPPSSISQLILYHFLFPKKSSISIAPWCSVYIHSRAPWCGAQTVEPRVFTLAVSSSFLCSACCPGTLFVSCDTSTCV